MSYDVSFRVKIESADKFVEVGDTYNYTYNLAEAIAVASGNDFNVRMLDGKTGDYAIKCLEPIIHEFTFNKLSYIQYEPDNGWGDIDTCREFLQNIVNVCKEYPMCIISVD